jgi:hypothetical protein
VLDLSLFYERGKDENLLFPRMYPENNGKKF